MENIRRYTFFKVFFYTIDLSKKIFSCGMLLFFYAAITTFLTIICGQLNYGCQDAEKNILCNILPQQPNIAWTLSGVYLLLSIILVAFFSYDFYNSAFTANKTVRKQILSFNKEKIKAALFFIGYLLCLILPIIFEFLILYKNPHPDWRIEFIFFLMLFGFVMFNFITIRVFGIISRFYRGEQNFGLALIMRQTSGKTFVAIILFLIILGILNVLIMNVNGILQRWSLLQGNMITSICAEFCSNFVLLFCVAFMITFSRAQDDLLATTEDKVISEAKTNSAPKIARTKKVSGKSAASTKKKSARLTTKKKKK